MIRESSLRAHRDSDEDESEPDEHQRVALQCAEALAEVVKDRSAPVMDIGCGAGRSGEALHTAGFSTIDGLDESGERLSQAAERGIYRNLVPIDLSHPAPVEEGAYANAAAMTCLGAGSVPATLLDAVVRKLPKGGCLVFCVDEQSPDGRQVLGRLMELLDCGFAELLRRQFREGGDGKVYVLRRR